MCGRSFLRWDTTGSFQRALSFSLRTCATLRSSGSDPASGGTCKIRTCDLYPFRLSNGFRPAPGSACPRLFRGVSSVAFGAVYFAGAASKGIPAHYPQVTRLSPDCGEASQGSGLSCRQRGAIPHAPKCGAVIRPAACVLPAAGGEPPGGFGGNMERECRDTWTIPLHPPL